MKQKLNILDSLEVLRFDDNRSEYPVHYHDTYCFSIIRKGVFCENELISPQGSILVSHPNEVHDNKLFENIGASFTTFYVSPDVVNHFSSLKTTTFSNKVIDDPIFYSWMNELAQSAVNQTIDKDSCHDYSKQFSQFILGFCQTYGSDEPYLNIEPSLMLESVKQYIEEHLASKIKLEALAKITKMNKFQFSRWFKKQTGVTAFDYILMKRVGLGRQMIQQGSGLVDVSLDSGFYDQSHFSNYFKRYVGMSPKEYKQSCNIFQDFTS